MNTLANGLSYIDLQFRGVSRAIATAVLQGADGVALVDPGPSSTLPTLRASLEERGIKFADLTSLLLTHIHLDHAGASGTLVRENPQLRVYVHEKGAPHMVDPAKLLASAVRLYGDEMDSLWGEFLPVPSENLTILRGGERIQAAGRSLDVAYTPGHAAHHVSYFHRDADVAFVGDTAGIRVRPDGYMLPPTPPPDIDLEAWRTSLSSINDWRAGTLFITHFGPSSPAGAHLSEFADRLEADAELAKRLLAKEGTDEQREGWFIEEMRRNLRRHLSEADAASYEIMGRLDLSWRGLARYWKKKGSR
jgi:glyoxylase-like metal-dependent hydrolase (beta-lactamase superfamily II)